MGTRVFAPVAASVTFAILVASCSLSADGLASRAEEGEGSNPARAGSVPGATDAGATSLSSSAPPGVIPPEAGAPVTPPPADSGVAPPMGGPMTPPTMTPPTMTPPTMTPPPVPQVVRAHDVKVKRLIAGTVYLHKLVAKAGTAGKITILPEPLLGLELGSKNLEADELIVDTLYAHDVQADFIQITETHATEVKIDKRRVGEDD